MGDMAGALHQLQETVDGTSRFGMPKYLALPLTLQVARQLLYSVLPSFSRPMAHGDARPSFLVMQEMESSNSEAMQ